MIVSYHAHKRILLMQRSIVEGKHVVKAQETNNEKHPWEFSPIAA
jgi:hypothetical protein